MKTKKSQAQRRQDFKMAAILANCRGCQIEDKVDGTVSKQVTNGPHQWGQTSIVTK